MAQATSQNLSNHTRLDPPYHFVLLPLLLIALILSVIEIFRNPSVQTVWMLVVSVAFIIAALKLRAYPLRAQDRLIRLEEHLRMERLFSDAERTIIPQLTEQQLIALRFAPDSELPALAEAAVSKAMKPGQIKKSIVSWRPDYFRV